MRIPKEFYLMGQRIVVEYDEALNYKDDVHGFASYREGKITLQPPSESSPMQREMLEQTFMHELIHHVLYHAGEDSFDPPLHKREFLVDRIASLVHQALETAKGDV